MILSYLVLLELRKTQVSLTQQLRFQTLLFLEYMNQILKSFKNMLRKYELFTPQIQIK